ncbi:MAG: GatB/YqeY domain-containing protein [Psychromonas sp.]|nr:GatB/YqeY domain-containing protein [Psychromonas sp.]
MELRDQLNNDLKTALKSGDRVKVATLRGLKSALKYAEIDAGSELDKDGLLAVISKQAKQRRDSITEFTKANRTDLVDQETLELAILEQYLPAQLSEDDVKAKVTVIIEELGVTNMRGMGQVMKASMAELKGKADGKIVSKVVKELLSK